MPGDGFTAPRVGQVRSDRLALEPYSGKPTVRNLRGGGGDVGIIRSPVRATALPDKGQSSCPHSRAVWVVNARGPGEGRSGLGASSPFHARLDVADVSNSLHETPAPAATRFAKLGYSPRPVPAHRHPPA
jgi:hypothetical protein